MKLEDCAKIDGWMALDELIWLSQQARKHRLIVEVGSFMGRSTAALAETPGTVIAVDTWKGSDEHRNELELKLQDWLWNEFNLNLRKEIKQGKVWPKRMTSLEAAKTWTGPCPDMVFLDAAHDYISVRNDIIAWGMLVKPGGLLCGHDYDNDTDTGVEQAVKEIVTGFKLMERAGRLSPQGSIWYKERALEKDVIHAEHRELRTGNHGDHLPVAEALRPEDWGELSGNQGAEVSGLAGSL